MSLLGDVRLGYTASVQVFFQSMPSPPAQAFTLMASVAMRWRIQRVTRDVTDCWSSAAWGIGARKNGEFTVVVGAERPGYADVQDAGVSGDGRVRQPTFNVVADPARKSAARSGEVDGYRVGQYRWVTSPSSAALSIDRPNSAVRQIVSVTMFGAGIEVTVGLGMDPVVDEVVD